MPKTGIGLFDQGLEALEEGAKQTVQGVGQQLGAGVKNAATQVTGSNFNTKPQVGHSTEQKTENSPNATAQHAGTEKNASAENDKQEMLKAFYGPSSEHTVEKDAPAQHADVKTQTEQTDLERTRQRLEQEKQQHHQQQHNEVYFEKLNKPEAKQGQQEESQQERVEREKAEEEKKKQMELQDKQKKDEKVNAPSKHSAEHERKLGG